MMQGMDLEPEVWEEVYKPNKKNEDVDIPWIEKYRPIVLDDVCSQDETISILKKTISLPDVNVGNIHTIS